MSKSGHTCTKRSASLDTRSPGHGCFMTRFAGPALGTRGFPRRRRLRPGRVVIPALLLVLLLIPGSTGAWYAGNMLPVVITQRAQAAAPDSDIPQAGRPQTGSGEGTTLAPPSLFVGGTSDSPDGSMTVLVMGIDARPGEEIDMGVRPDTLIVVDVEPGAGVCHALSIPRDARVNLPGYGQTKINHALSVGGVTVNNERAFECGGFKLPRGLSRPSPVRTPCPTPVSATTTRAISGANDASRRSSAACCSRPDGLDAAQAMSRPCMQAIEGHFKTDLTITQPRRSRQRLPRHLHRRARWRAAGWRAPSATTGTSSTTRNCRSSTSTRRRSTRR